MPRKAVINRISQAHDISKVDAEAILRTALAAIAEELACRGRFHVAEVGSISVAKRPPRRYFNPRTQAEAISLGDTSLKINISKQMRERVCKE